MKIERMNWNEYKICHQFKTLDSIKDMIRRINDRKLNRDTKHLMDGNENIHRAFLVNILYEHQKRRDIKFPSDYKGMYLEKNYS